jgi:hypothetical protein
MEVVMVRTLASLLMCVLAGAFFAGPLQAQSIVGAWYFGDTRSDDSGVVVFLDSGYYFHIVNAEPIEAPGGYDGFERGTYTWNATTGAFTATTVYNGDGDLGLSGLSGVGGLKATVNGDTLCVELPGEVVTLNRVIGPSPIVGAWFKGNPAAPSDTLLLVFLLDNTYFMAQADIPDAGGQPGIEHGTYTWDRASFAFTSSRSPAPYVDTNGTWGLSDLGGPATVRISADGTTLTAIVLAETLHIPRAGATYVPKPILANTAVEYYHADFEHYFATSIAKEISDLDAGVHRGWARTGQSFQVFPLGTPNTADVCRLFSEAFAPRSSHFYSPNRAECELRASSGVWNFEGNVFGFRPINAAYGCDAGTVPLFRFYNNSDNGVPNHRFTTSMLVRSQMIAEGWQPEGDGPLAVNACVPQ